MNFESIKQKKTLFLFLGVVVLFLVLRLPNIHYPYHQDEYKWVMYSHSEMIAEGTVPHPPLTEFIYGKILGPLFGDDNFRFVPLAFSVINLFLIFYLAKIIFDKKSAFWVAFLFTISFFSVLASLMVDVDGAVMPMFFLIMAIGYVKLRAKNFELGEKSWIWLTMIVIGAIGGFMVKVSGILPIVALFLDFLIEKGVFSDKKRILKYLGVGVLGVFVLVALLFIAKFIFPFFNLQYSLKYWQHFANSSSFFGRGWFQTFIQFMKAVLYTSPLLILPLVFVDREIWKKTRPFFLFIFTGLIFYLFVFDFSIGALDRYMQFLIVPLCIISGVIFAKYLSLKSDIKANKNDFIIVSIIALGIFSLQFFNQFVPPLHPKTEWLSRLVSFKWNFLYPFSGGSGPLPFYVSFEFIAIIWICSLVFVLSTLKIKNIKKRVIFCVLVLGILYNGVFIEEYLFGKINGSSYKLVTDSVAFVENNKDIKKVIVYNDNGGWEVRKIGKYERRMYATPQAENEYKKILENFSGHILFVNAPTISEQSFYANYMKTCKEIYSEKDKYIIAQIFDCRK